MGSAALSCASKADARQRHRQIEAAIIVNFIFSIPNCKFIGSYTVSSANFANYGELISVIVAIRGQCSFRLSPQGTCLSSSRSSSEVLLNSLNNPATTVCLDYDSHQHAPHGLKHSEQ